MTEDQKKIIVALTLEARHLKGGIPYQERLGLEFNALILATHGKREADVKRIASAAMYTPFLALVKQFEHLFSKGKFPAAYGGPPWAKICEQILQGDPVSKMNTWTGPFTDKLKEIYCN